MARALIVREGLILLATGVAFCVLALILPPLFGIKLWPILTTMPFTPLVILFYVLVRWMQCSHRYH